MTVFQIAKRHGRDYITPEDVGGALQSGCPLQTVRRDVLKTIGRISGWGAEDYSLCAFVTVERCKRRKVKA